MILRCKVLFARGTIYFDGPLPCAWASLKDTDVFIFTKSNFQPGAIVRVAPISCARVAEDQLISDVVVGVPEGEKLDREELRTFEAVVGKFLHRNFEVTSWGNREAVIDLILTKYAPEKLKFWK